MVVLRLNWFITTKWGISGPIYSPDLAIDSPVFKTGDTVDISNHHPISILPFFSKIFELVMYNRQYKYLINKIMLHPEQFGFRKGHSTEHAIPQLVDQI